jgi:glycosyltransferase involved in cell wall biosynthesis
MDHKLLGEYEVHHFSTGHIGGAGLAARRLNASLNLGGQVSYFYSLARHDFEPEENEFSINRSWFHRIQGGFFSRLQAQFARKTLFTPLSSSAVSIGYFKRNFDKSKDIIHFHNWYNLVSLKTILDLDREGYIIVLTIHDQRFMTAGCHYTFDCVGFQQSCGACPILPRIISPILEIRRRKELKKFRARNSSHRNSTRTFSGLRWFVSRLPTLGKSSGRKEMVTSCISRCASKRCCTYNIN